MDADLAAHQWGPSIHEDGTVTFRIWAPHCASLELNLVGRDLPSPQMERRPDGTFSIRTKAGHGDRYWFRLPDGRLRPDPASRFQPEGVHGPSQVVDPSRFQWHDNDWQGLANKDLILYELHLGTFTAAGTYLAAIERLDELVDLGITGLELMPIAQSAGSRNWGYDGVNLFSPRQTYGTPDELRQFVDEAHRRGLAVMLDVVYNHFGPEGNYLHDLGPYVSQKHLTAWGDGPNFDGENAKTVRAFILDNVRYWIEDYHLDGLRLDAIHCLRDDSSPHIAMELATGFGHLRRRLNRSLHLIAESNVFDRELITPAGPHGDVYDALWCDDFIHSVFAILRPGDHMSSREYHPHTDMDLVLRRGFVFEGGLSTHRRRIPLDETTPPVTRQSLIFAIQNHDFVGNHPQGRRLHQLTSPEAHRAAAALLLLSPSIPMLFMGEEFATESPFFFFADFNDAQIRESVEEGRRREYPQHDWADVDSPLSDAAFERSNIGDRADGDEQTLDWYRQLIRVRKDWSRSGVLAADGMQAHWDQELHVAILQYESGENSGFAVVRLHPAGEFPRRVHLQVDGEIVCMQGCEPVEDDPKDQYMGEHAVAVGLGTATVALVD